MTEQFQDEAVEGGVFEDPAMLRAVLGDPRNAWVWLFVRLAAGWLLLDAGWRQLQTPGDGTRIVAVGLTIAGIALLLGVLAGVAAFGGGALLAMAPLGSGLTGIALFAAIVWLILAWKTAGWIGLDRWLLPLIGMPWRRGPLLAADADWDSEIGVGWIGSRRGIRQWTERGQDPR